MAVGDRVYVNPWLTCGMCPYCRANEPLLCSSAAFQGYFGFFPHSIRQLREYPFGGFSEYITASPQRLVPLPQQVSFDQAARFGYLGTSFAALRWRRSAAAAGSLSTGSPARWESARPCSRSAWARRAFSGSAGTARFSRN